MRDKNPTFKKFNIYYLRRAVAFIIMYLLQDSDVLLKYILRLRSPHFLSYGRVASFYVELILLELRKINNLLCINSSACFPLGYT